MRLTSSAFENQGPIPRRFTCDGEDLSPPLLFADIPPSAKSLALIVDDPDAPDPKSPMMTWVHWVLYNLPPTTSGLAEGVQPINLPAGTREGVNDWKRTGYGGPSPPVGRHRYFFKLYALKTVLPDLGQSTKAKLEKAIAGQVLAEAVLMGTYAR